jgi:hypothetical protein
LTIFDLLVEVVSALLFEQEERLYKVKKQHAGSEEHFS